jgi:hypothetical protein
MIKVFCRKCKQSLQEPGGLIISPPETEGRYSSKVYKMHLCLQCYFMLMDWLEISPQQERKIK